VRPARAARVRAALAIEAPEGHQDAEQVIAAAVALYRGEDPK